MKRKILLSLFTLFVILTVGTSGGYLWLRTSLPRADGSVSLRGLDGPVDVVRDANAVPHIIAGSPHDAYFALGYVHAQDRLWQMEMMRRAGAGRLAEVFGEPALDIDRKTRTLGLYRVAEAMYANASPEVRAALEAYAAGVNTWLATRSGAPPPEFIALWYDPELWRPADSLVWSRLMALRLGRNRNHELLRSCIAGELESRGLPPGLVEELWPEYHPDAPVTLASAAGSTGVWTDALWELPGVGLEADNGSNIWAVHGEMTQTGKPILANDPHLGFDAPILWYLARIEAPGLSLTGATVPGVPFTVLGHNGRIAWGMTNARGDVEDLFVETVDPDNPDTYLAPDGPRSFETREETIHVKSSGDVTISVRETRHGPVVSDIWPDAACAGSVVAFATPALSHDDRTVEALHAINLAQDWPAFRAAAGKFHTPHANLVFASLDGDICLVSAGRIPVRKAGDGGMPVPGAGGAYDREGFIPGDELPSVCNPESGRIVNANNDVDGGEYPYLITNDPSPPYRAERIIELLDGRQKHSVPDSEALQRDVLSVAARRLVPLMAARTEPSGARERKALALLSSWNFEMRRDRPEPLIYAVWLRRFVSVLAADEIGKERTTQYLNMVFKPGPRFVETVLGGNEHWCDDVGTTREETCEEQLETSLVQALDEIAAKQGPDPDKWRWGELHRATFTHRVFTNIPVLRRWADLSIESDGGDNTVNVGSTARGRSPNPYSHTGGAGYRAVYDLSDLDDSRFMIATGQSGNVLSPHYGDLLQRWRDGKYIRIAGIRNHVEKVATGGLLLLPGK